MSDELTTKQAAERLGESDRVVRLWCAGGRFPNARRVEHPRGDYWVIPTGDLKNFVKPKPGPVPKAKEESALKKSAPATPNAAIGHADASNGGATAKKKAKGKG
jgi:hypothetical protein